MDRSGQLAKVPASLAESWRTLAAADAGNPCLAGLRADILAWRELMHPWREGAVGAKRTVALAGEIERYIVELRSGFEADRAAAAVEAARIRAERERQTEATRRTALAEEHRRLLAGTAEVGCRQATDDARMQRATARVASLFAPGDLRDAGPG